MNVAMKKAFYKLHSSIFLYIGRKGMEYDITTIKVCDRSS